MVLSFRGVPDGGIADHSVETATSTQQIDQNSTKIGIGRERQVGHDVSDLPPLTQAGVTPLWFVEWFE